MENITMNNKEKAKAKLQALQQALAECDIASELTETKHGDLLLMAEMWNCDDGSTVRLEVWADSLIDYNKIESCVNPIEKVAKKIENFFKTP